MSWHRLELGFLSFVPNPYGPDQAGRALEDGLRLFEEFPSSPLTFLSAASQCTRRIRLGTGVIPRR